MRLILLYIVFILSFLFFECSILSNLVFLPVIPDFLLLFTVYISVQKGSLHGESVGFFSGLLLDFVSAAPLGLNAFLRTIIGFLSGLLHLTVGTSGILTPIILGVTATFSKVFLVYVISFFFPAVELTYDFFSKIFLFECVFNGLLAPVLFYIFSKFQVLSQVGVSSITEMGK